MSRIELTADTTLHVSPTGCDANDGLSQTTAWLSPSEALKRIQYDYDLRGKKLVLQSHYPEITENLELTGPVPGAAGEFTEINLILRGDVVNRGNRIIAPTSGNGVAVQAGGRLLVEGFALQTYGGDCLIADGGAELRCRHVDFYQASSHMSAGPFARCGAIGDYRVMAGAGYHLKALDGQVQISPGVTVSLMSSPAFTGYFAFATEGGLINAAGVTYVGTIAGRPYGLALQSKMYNGSPATPFPGDHVANPPYIGAGCYAPY